MSKSYWAEIRNDYDRVIDDDKHGDALIEVYIDAWRNPDDDDHEEGKVIAKVIFTKSGDICITYHNYMASEDSYAQEIISETISELRKTAKLKGFKGDVEMPIPIIPSEEIEKEEYETMKNSISLYGWNNSSLTPSLKLPKDITAKLWISDLAYSKTTALLSSFSTEVGWHGTVSRKGEHEYIIEDIFVYPQEGTEVAINTDLAEYTKWLYDCDDETFNKRRMHGHSHVYMDTKPSGVDMEHRDKIIKQLKTTKDGFYIFMIWNKHYNINNTIYDMKSDMIFENREIKVERVNSVEVKDFLKGAQEKVRQPKEGSLAN